MRIRGPLESDHDPAESQGCLFFLLSCAVLALVLNSCTGNALVAWLKTAYGP